MANNEALANYASTKEGRKYLSQFAFAGQTISINGKEFTFDDAGKYSASNLNFIGYADYAEGMTQVSTSIGGLELNNYLGVDGVHNYNISIASNMSLGSQMDAIFHEVQHSSMFEQGQFRGMINSKIGMLHHGAMMQSALWTSHERFINQANSTFNAGINASRVYGGVGKSGGLYRQLYGQFGLQILNRMNQNKRIPY